MSNVTTMDEGQISSEKKGHPLGFYVCTAMFIFSNFAYYGSKTLLLLFLVTGIGQGGLGIENAKGAVIAANLVAYGALTPIVGGIISDRWIGARYTVFLGALITGIGYMIGYGAESVTTVHIMIYVVAIGSGLYKGNIPALIGKLYDDKSQLDSAFTLQYSLANIGGFVGSLLTGYLYLNTFAKDGILGFRQCFLISGITMVVASIFFATVGWKTLGDIGKEPFEKDKDKKDQKLQTEENSSGDNNLSQLEKNRVKAIILVSLLSVLFWTFWYQSGSTLIFYMTEKVDMTIGKVDIAPSWVDTTLNSLLCIGLGPVFAYIWGRLANRPKGDLNMFEKVALGFFFLGLGFMMIVLAEVTRQMTSTGLASISWMIMFAIFTAIGEMCFSPLGSSFVSKFAPAKYTSMLMGVWTFATFLSSKIMGYVQGVVEKFGTMQVFTAIPILLFLSAFLLFANNKKLNSLVTGENL